MGWRSLTRDGHVRENDPTSQSQSATYALPGQPRVALSRAERSMFNQSSESPLPLTSLRSASGVAQQVLVC
jgi:hypothetical protein